MTKTGKATPHKELIGFLLDSCTPKSEVEWAAKRHIEELEYLLRLSKCPNNGEDGNDYCEEGSIFVEGIGGQDCQFCHDRSQILEVK